MEEPSLDTSEVNYKQLDNIKALDSGEPVIKDGVMYIWTSIFMVIRALLLTLRT